MKTGTPSDEQVVIALKKVFSKVHMVSSQSKLKILVDKELYKDKVKEKTGVSAGRLRNIAISSGFIKLEIHSREGDPKKILTRCPVCNSNLKNVKNLTIWGGKVTIEFSCKNCGYWTGKKKRIPTRYIFYLKKK